MNLVFQLKVLQLLVSTSNFLWIFFMTRTKDGWFPPLPNLSAALFAGLLVFFFLWFIFIYLTALNIKSGAYVLCTTRREEDKQQEKARGELNFPVLVFFLYIVLASRNQILLIINSSISVDTPVSNRRRVFVLVNELAIGEVHNEITYHLWSLCIC